MAVQATSTATVLDVMRRSAFDGSREAPGAVSGAWLATAWAAEKIISSLIFAARETMTHHPIAQIALNGNLKSQENQRLAAVFLRNRLFHPPRFATRLNASAILHRRLIDP